MGSKRLPNKNLLPFGDETLLGNACKIALKSKYINEIYVFSSSEYLQKHIPKDVKFLKRDASLDSDETTGNQILKAFSNIIKSDIYVLLHATAPFLNSDVLDEGIENVISKKFDSA